MAKGQSISQIAIASNMVQGVSQQAAQQRRSAQAEEQFDCTNSVLDGVIPRPHAQFVKELWNSTGGVHYNLEGGFFTETSHGPDESYVICTNAAGLPVVFNLDDGTLCSLTNDTSVANALTYLGQQPGTIAKDTIRSQVVDDTTFLLNRNVKPAMLVTRTPAKKNEAIVFVRSTTFNADYQVRLTGPGGNVSSLVYTAESNTSPTRDIAQCLLDNVITSAAGVRAGSQPLNGTSGYTCVRYGSTLHIYRADGQPFSVSTEDGNGDDYMYAFNGSVTSYTKLPARAPSGTILKVAGEDKTTEDDYYVKFEGDPSTGRWLETVGPSTKTTISPTTMPVSLICTDLNTFTLKTNNWSTRISGDENTAKDPGFIGKNVQGLGYHQARLGMIWTGGVVFSKTKNPFTWFPDTVQTVLATSPVDTLMAGSSGKGPPSMDFMLEFQENLFAFAQQQQYRISSGSDPFKADTVEVRNAMAYEYSPLSYPLGLGSFLFLSTDVGMNATLRAIMFNGGKLGGDTDVSSHAPKYIPSGVSSLTGSDTLRQLYIVAEGDQSVLTQFAWTYSSQEGFIQTALNKWRIPGGKVLWASIKSNILRLIQQRPEGAFLYHFNLSPQAVDDDPGAEYMTRLDFRVDEAQVTGLTYDAVNNWTSFSLPYKPTGSVEDFLVVTRQDKVGGFTRGRQFETLLFSDYGVRVKGDLRGYKFYAGHRIRAERLDSQFFIRSENGAEPVTDITINRFKVEMANTQYTRIEVTYGEQTAVEVFEGRVLGAESGKTGVPSPVNYDLDIGIGWRSDEVKVRLINDTFMQSSWQNSSYDFDAVGWKGAK